jgi:hypothetical protein
MIGPLSTDRRNIMPRKLAYLGLGLALTVAALASGVRPAAAASNCTTICDPNGCCSTCCRIGNKIICTERIC